MESDTGDSTGTGEMNPDFVRWFRNSSPYINAHKGRTFVLAIDGEAIERSDFAQMVQDISLLSSLGVRLVLVHGARPQLDARLAQAAHKTIFLDDRRIADLQTLRLLTEVCGSLRCRIESQLSMGLPNSPMHGAMIRVSGGNFVTAQPEGVIEGIDFQHTGRVRRVDSNAINAQLDAGCIVLLSPLGYSPTGEIFSLGREELALAVATALQAHKLILIRNSAIKDGCGALIRELTLDEARQRRYPDTNPLATPIQACTNGVECCQVLDYHQDGALLQELFSRDGVGTFIKRMPFEAIRQATIEDVGGIMTLLAPLEEDGTLVRRSRELLEMEIKHFYVAERDGAVIGCAALYSDSQNSNAELACVATHPDYRGSGRGERLLEHVETVALSSGVQQLFALTTVSAHWFREHGFVRAKLDELPAQRQALYNYQRNSQVYLKTLDGR